MVCKKFLCWRHWLKGQTDQQSILPFCPWVGSGLSEQHSPWGTQCLMAWHMTFSCISKEEDSLGRVKELFSHHRAVFTYSALGMCSSKGATVSSDEWHLQKGDSDMHRSGVVTRQPPRFCPSTDPLQFPTSATAWLSHTCRGSVKALITSDWVIR